MSSRVCKAETGEFKCTAYDETVTLAVGGDTPFSCKNCGGHECEMTLALAGRQKEKETVSKRKKKVTAYKLRDEFVQREETRIANINKLRDEIVQMEAKKAAVPVEQLQRAGAAA